jgi:hypothetical protein
VKDREFYDEHVYDWFPDPTKGIKNEKKLLGLAIEKHGENCIALSPKCYTIWTEQSVKEYEVTDFETGETITYPPRTIQHEVSMKVKGVSRRKNKLDFQDYEDAMTRPKTGKNICLIMKDGQMSKIHLIKNALTGVHTKMIVEPVTQACMPFLYQGL